MGAVRVSGAAAGYCTDVANDMETQTAEAETDKSEIEAKLAQTGPSRSQGLTKNMKVSRFALRQVHILGIALENMCHTTRHSVAARRSLPSVSWGQSAC